MPNIEKYVRYGFEKTNPSLVVLVKSLKWSPISLELINRERDDNWVFIHGKIGTKAYLGYNCVVHWTVFLIRLTVRASVLLLFH